MTGSGMRGILYRYIGMEHFKAQVYNLETGFSLELYFISLFDSHCSGFHKSYQPRIV